MTVESARVDLYGDLYAHALLIEKGRVVIVRKREGLIQGPEKASACCTCEILTRAQGTREVVKA